MPTLNINNDVVLFPSANVSIGNSTSTSRLFVSLNEGTYIGAANASAGVGAGNYWGFGLYEGTSLSAAFRIVRDGTGDQVSIGTANNQSFSFWQNGTERARIAVGGNFLIGTTTDSGYKLNVNGSIFGTSIVKSGGTSSQYLMADGSVSTTATINNYTQTFFVPDTGGTAQWVKLGTWTAAQGGQVVTIEIAQHAGYNATTTQNQSVSIFMKTSNGSSVDANGFAADSTFWTQGLNAQIGAGNVLWEANAAGVSATAYTLYLYLGAYTNGSQYTVTTRGGTWANVGTLTSPSSTSPSSTILLSEYRLVANNVLTLVGSGNVLIGTSTDSGYKLAVNGKAVFGTSQSLEIGNAAANPTASGISYGIFHQSGVGLGIVSGAGGTTQGIDFWSNDGSNFFQSMRIAGGNGNVGIGTTTPAARLQVAGSTSFFNGASGTGAINAGESETITTGFNLGPSESLDISTISLSSNTSWKAIVSGEYANNLEGGGLTSSALEIELDSDSPTIDVGSTDITFSRNSSTGKLQVTNTNASYRVTFVGSIRVWNYPQSGKPTISKVILKNVGIGTTSPATALQISASSVLSQGVLSVINSYASGGVYYPAARFINQRGDHSYGIVSEFYTGATSGTDKPSILFNTGVSSNSWQVGMVTSGWGGNDSFGIGYRASNDPASFSSWPTTRFLITTGGNVLIGTTTDAGYILEVNGTSRTNGVIVGSDTTYGDPYRVVAFGGNQNGYNRIFAATGATDGMYFAAATGQGFNFRPNGGTTNSVFINASGELLVGSTSSGSASIQAFGGTAMTSGWTRTLYLDANYPCIAMRSSAGGNSYVGFMWDSGSNFIMNMGSSADLPTNTGVFSVNASTRNFMIGTTTDAGYKLRVAGNVLTFGGIYNQGDHYTSWIQNTLPAAYNGAGQGDVQLRMWCSEPGVTWSWAGFGYNVNNDGASPYGFSRTNTSFGQAYMRFSTDGSLYFYNANTSGTRVQTAAFGYDASVTFSGAGSFAGNLTMTQDTNDLIFQQTNSSSHGIVWKNTSYAKDSASIRPTGNGAWATQGIGFYTGNAGDSTTAPSLRFNIQAGGDSIFYNNVGIGTTAPTAPLEITNTGGAGGGYTMFNAYYSAAKQWGMRKYGIDNGSGIAFSSDVQFSSTWYSATRIGHGQNTNNPSLQTYYGTQLCTTSGNVLIGTTTDAGYKLDVHGEILGRDDIRILNTYALILNGTDANWRIGRNTITDSGWLTGNTMQMVVFGSETGQGFQVVNSNGTALFEIDGVAGASRFSNALGVGVNPSGTAGRIDASNDIVAYSSSDKRLKENITPIANALDKVKALTGVEFDWKPEHKEAHGYEGHDTGVIAQEVKEVMPTAVRENETGFLAVRYEKLIGLLVESVKELNTKVDSQNETIALQAAMIEKLMETKK